MHDVARELGLLFRSIKGMHHDVLAEIGVRLEMPAAAMLTTLDDRGRMRPSGLAEALDLDLSSVSRQAAALEREGYVSRERDPEDSRAALLELTPAGGDVLARLRAGRVAHLRRLLPAWTDDELTVFAEQLHRFRTDLTTSPAVDPPGHTDDPTPESPTDRMPALAGQESA